MGYKAMATWALGSDTGASSQCRASENKRYLVQSIVHHVQIEGARKPGSLGGTGSA